MKKNKIKKTKVNVAHGHDENGTPFWIGPSGMKHYQFSKYLEDVENDIRDQVINS